MHGSNKTSLNVPLSFFPIIRSPHSRSRNLASYIPRDPKTKIRIQGPNLVRPNHGITFNAQYRLSTRCAPRSNQVQRACAFHTTIPRMAKSGSYFDQRGRLHLPKLFTSKTGSIHPILPASHFCRATVPRALTPHNLERHLPCTPTAGGNKPS